MASSGAIGTHGPKTASRGVPKGTSADPNRPGSCGTSSAAHSRCPRSTGSTPAHLEVGLASFSAGLGGREDKRPGEAQWEGNGMFSAVVEMHRREHFVMRRKMMG